VRVNYFQTKTWYIPLKTQLKVFILEYNLVLVYSFVVIELKIFARCIILVVYLGVVLYLFKRRSLF
jgi:hypothetical protein